MDVEDEANSYLKFLNDSEAPNAYLLENNEVGLFSVEPIFTDMGSTDWQQEGFPLLLTQSLIPEEECKNAEEAISTHLNANEIVSLSATTTVEELPAASELKIKEDEENSFSNQQSSNGPQKIIQLLDLDGTTIPIDDSVLKSISSSSLIQKPLVDIQNTTKPIDDLFSVVLAKKCNICSYLCEDLAQIKAHISKEHLEGIVSQGNSMLRPNLNKISESSETEKKLIVYYVCSECHKMYTNKNDLKEHMIESHGLVTSPEVPNLCSVNKALETKPKGKVEAYIDDPNIALVRRQEKFLQKLKCTVKGCLASFPSQELQKKHEKMHIGSGKSTFSCSDCDKTFKMWSIARTHMYSDHGIDFGMIVCPLCNKYKSYKPVSIFRHMLVHSEDKHYLCSDCGKTFKQLAQLRNHEVLHKSPKEIPPWSKVKQCAKCLEFFSNAKSLKSHIKTIHEQIKPFICNICGHKSSRKALLELHMRQHTASKPHKCPHCQFRTGDKSSLRKHVMRHVGMVAYQCPHCPYKCIQSGSIKTHLLAKHKSKSGVYSCKYCSYTTINEGALRAHEKRHGTETNKAHNENLLAQSTADGDLPTDEETQSCFLSGDTQLEETEDKGGITIPAGLEMPLVS